MIKTAENGMHFGEYYVEPPKAEGKRLKDIPPPFAITRQQRQQDRLIREQERLVYDPFYRALSLMLLQETEGCFRAEYPGNNSLWYGLLQEIAIRSFSETTPPL